MAGSAAWVPGSVTPLLMARTRALIVDYPGDAAGFARCCRALRSTRTTRDAQRVEHPREAALELLGGAAQHRRDVPRRGAVHEHAEDREILLVERAPGGLEERGRDVGQRALAGGDRADRLEELVRLAALVDDPVDARDQAGDDERRVGVRAVE